MPDPRFSFQQTPRYNVQRETVGFGVKYHVNSAEFTGHPVIGAELAREKDVQPPKADSTCEPTDSTCEPALKKKMRQRGPALASFESMVERAYTQELYSKCQRGVDRREREKEREVGLFGIGTDWQKVKEIESQVIESCEELKRLGVLPR